jgi:hypothetical protein
MIIFTPKVGRLIALDGMMSDEEVSAYKGRALSELKERGAEQIIAHIVQDCTKMDSDEHLRATTFSIRAIVMSEDEFRDAITQAYMNGRRDGMPRYAKHPTPPTTGPTPKEKPSEQRNAETIKG